MRGEYSPLAQDAGLLDCDDDWHYAHRVEGDCPGCAMRAVEVECSLCEAPVMIPPFEHEEHGAGLCARCEADVRATGGRRAECPD